MFSGRSCALRFACSRTDKFLPSIEAMPADRVWLSSSRGVGPSSKGVGPLTGGLSLNRTSVPASDRRSARISFTDPAVSLTCPAMLPASLPVEPSDLPATKPANAASDIRIVALFKS